MDGELYVEGDVVRWYNGRINRNLTLEKRGINMAKKEERFEVIRRLGLTIFVGTPDLEPVLHLFWIRKEKS